jgi:hypothetical protein
MCNTNKISSLAKRGFFISEVSKTISPSPLERGRGEVKQQQLRTLSPLSLGEVGVR